MHLLDMTSIVMRPAEEFVRFSVTPPVLGVCVLLIKKVKLKPLYSSKWPVGPALGSGFL